MKGFSEFFAILSCDTHFKSELRSNGWDRPRLSDVKFSALNVDFSSLSLDPLSLRSSALASCKEKYPSPKKRLFYHYRLI